MTNKEKIEAAITEFEVEFLGLEPNVDTLSDSAVYTIQTALRVLKKSVDGGWQPIESAPKDGDQIFIYYKDDDCKFVTMGQWRDDYKPKGFYEICLNDEYEVVIENPILWKPIEIPQENDKEG